MSNLSVVGWVMVALYAAAAANCFVASSAAAAVGTRERRIWLAIAVVIFALGLGRLFDLQAIVTDIGRAFALDHGWYRERQFAQQTVVVLALLIGIAAIILLAVWARRTSRLLQIALIGTVTVAGLAIVRAVSLHQVDVFGGSRILGLRIYWIVELGSIALVLVSAYLRMRARR